MSIDYFDEDLCQDDIKDIDNLEELEDAEGILENVMLLNEEQNVILKDNVAIIKKRIKEIKNENI